MAWPRILLSCSSPKMTPAATTMGEKTPSLCGFPPPAFFGFLGATAVVVLSTTEDDGMGGMSMINFLVSLWEVSSLTTCCCW